MKKLLTHAWQILVGGLIIVLFAFVDLNKYPLMRYVDYLFWPMCVLFLFVALFYRWRHKACFILGLLMLSSPVFAGEHTVEICSYYKSYKARIERYKSNYFKQDEPCDKGMRYKARQEAQEYKLSLLDVATVGISYVGKKGKEWFDGSCANDLMSMCSEYERRHPETVTKTVPTIMNEAVGGTDENGKPTSCWPCDMAYVVFMVIQALSNNLSGIMAYISYMILLWGTAFWLVFKAFGMVLTNKGGTYFKQIAGGLIAVMIAALLLNDGGKHLSDLYSKFLSPVMQLGLSISENIQSVAGTESESFRSLTGSSQTFYQKLKSRSDTYVTSKTDFADYCGYKPSLSSSKNDMSDVLASWYSKMSSQFFPTMGKNFQTLTEEAKAGKQTLLTSELRSQFLCMTQRFYNQSLPFIATGQSLVSFASHDTKGFLHFVTRFPKKFMMWIFGGLLVCLFTYFGFLVAFRIMDIFLRLGFILVLMPLFVVTTVFPITREYTMKAWTFLFGVIVEFIGLAISMSFVMILLEAVVMPQSNELLNAMAAKYSGDYGENLYNAITQNMTWAFYCSLIAVVILGQKLLTTFPMLVASLFGVPDSSSKGTKGTLMAAGIGTLASQTVAGLKSLKQVSNSAAKNPYKTKETKAKEAQKDLDDKKKVLEEAKRNLAGGQKKLDRLKGTPKEKEAQQDLQQRQKDVDKAQKDVDEAQKKADAFRSQAEAERAKTDPSHSRYAARRFGYNAGNAVRKGSAAIAEKLESFGSKTNKLGLIGTPLTLGAKVLSMGIRAQSKVTEFGFKAAGRAGATVQKWNNKITGKAPPPRPKTKSKP